MMGGKKEPREFYQHIAHQNKTRPGTYFSFPPEESYP